LNKKKRTGDVWVTSTDQGAAVQVSGDESFDIHPLLRGAFEAWLRQEDFYYILEGDDLTKYYKAVRDAQFKLPESQMLSSETGFRRQYCFVAVYNSGGLFAFREDEFPEEARKVMRRFAGVFDLTYKRFLDIQKAEAQAREAKIEASLERVRAKAMGMHGSDDLMDTINLFYHEVEVLSITPRRCGVSLINKETRIAELSTMITTEEGGARVSMGHLKLQGHPVLDGAFESWLAQKDFFPILKGNEIREYYKVLTSQVDFRDYPSDEVQYGYYFVFPEGLVFAWTNTELGEDALSIYRRFTSVLNLTYKRYKDLKDAEERAQARLEDFRKLEEAKNKIEATLHELKATQTQLVQSEKMASLGELTAGIAHEIQNPLNFVNNFSEVSNELLDEMIEEVKKGNYNEAQSLVNDVKQNLEKINHHGKRADGIVKGMLQHSRSSSATKEPTDINKLADAYLRLAFHGLRAKDKTFNASMKTEFDESIGSVNIIPQDIGRVILNLLTNAFYVVNEKKGGATSGYVPTVTVRTKREGDKVLIAVKDNGNGIPQKVKDKIFQPFFTTKPTGQGTGLGLSLSYDIIKAHHGELHMETLEGEGSEFIIILPVKS
jgi:signal transduction histidine kinase